MYSLMILELTVTGVILCQNYEVIVIKVLSIISSQQVYSLTIKLISFSLQYIPLTAYHPYEFTYSFNNITECFLYVIY